MPAKRGSEGGLRGLQQQTDEAIKSAEKRRPFQYLTGIVLIEREAGFALVLLGSDRSGLGVNGLVNSLRLYWPEFEMSRDYNRFFGMDLLPVVLGEDGFTEEELARIKEFVGANGRIVHTAGYDHGLVREMNPEYQKARGKLRAWFRRDLEDLVSEMKGLSDELIIEAMCTAAPEFAPGGGFLDMSLTALMEIASKPSSWDGRLKDLGEFVSSRLVGSQGHPFENEVMGRTIIPDFEGRQPFRMVGWAKNILGVSNREIDRGIIFSLHYDLLTLLAPEEMRQMMMRNVLKGSNENVAERILWYNAIRGLVLEYLGSQNRRTRSEYSGD